MFYFDNEYLKQYLNMNKKVKIVVDNKTLTIADESDVEDSTQGVAYDAAGNSTFFDYMDIEQIMVGTNIITVDMLQQIRADEEPKKQEPPAQKKAPAEKEKPTDKEDDKPGVEKASYDPHMVGRLMIREYFKQKKNGRNN